jgi:hypothetical protein
MRWIKRKICGWLGVERYDDWSDDVIPMRDSVRIKSDAPTFFDRNPESNFRIYNATGGTILEVSRWDRQRSEWITNMHIINDDEENKTDAIAKIMTMELMR